jgi:hypothetical protein
MNKYKILGGVLMLSIIVAIVSAHTLGFTSVQWATESLNNAVLFISALCIVLFGSLSALTLDKTTD